MKRFVGLLGIFVTAAACGAVALAQQPTKVHRIGYLGGTSPSARSERFRQLLRELGYVEGKNIVLSGGIMKENSIVSPRSRAS